VVKFYAKIIGSLAVQQGKRGLKLPLVRQASNGFMQQDKNSY
jgi:hypothetical protein